eukprot:8658075-Pyramimonas_sp.AAC.1
MLGTSPRNFLGTCLGPLDVEGAKSGGWAPDFSSGSSGAPQRFGGLVGPSGAPWAVQQSSGPMGSRQNE